MKDDWYRSFHKGRPGRFQNWILGAIVFVMIALIYGPYLL